VLASLNGARESSRDARRQTDLNQVRTSLALFRDECGEFPGTNGVVEETLGNSNCNTTLGDHMSQVPSDPSSGEYGFASNSSNDGYCLAASLESDSVPSDSASSSDSVCSDAESQMTASNGGSTYFLTN